jgi:hypothetical protein
VSETRTGDIRGVASKRNALGHCGEVEVGCLRSPSPTGSAGPFPLAQARRFFVGASGRRVISADKWLVLALLFAAAIFSALCGMCAIYRNVSSTFRS